MTLPVRLTPAAEQDIVLALRWYLTEAPHVVARISHQLTAADADLPIFAALNTARVLDVPNGYACAP